MVNRGPVVPPLTLKQKEWLEKYARGARQVELKYSIPMEVCLGMTIVESGWIPSPLAMEANNFHGIKASPSEPFVVKVTDEHIAENKSAAFETSLKRRGLRIMNRFPLAGVSGFFHYIIEDKFRKFETPEDGFLGYGEFLTRHPNFKGRFSSFLQHKNIERFMQDLAMPPVYFTGKSYLPVWRGVVNRLEVQEIIKAMRTVQ